MVPPTHPSSEPTAVSDPNLQLFGICAFFPMFPMRLFTTGLPVMNTTPSFPLSGSLLVYRNERYPRHCILSSQRSYTNNYCQTSNGSSNLCSCYHDESYHRSPLSSPDIAGRDDHYSPVPVPPMHAVPPVPIAPGLGRPFQPFFGPTPPTSINSRLGLPVGIPFNQAAPILRPFRPFQGQSTSTSEDNRKKSIARKNSNKPRRKTQVATAREEPTSHPLDREVAVLLFPLNVWDILFASILLSHIPHPSHQISDLPECIEHLGAPPSFNIDCGSFGVFAQWMFDIGLVFDLRFTEDELLQPPSWVLFDQKIMDGVASLPARIRLPLRPSHVSASANGTLWTFVKCFTRAVRNQCGRKKYHLTPPPTITTTQWTLDHLTNELSVPNPISGPDDASVPQNLVIIGVSFRFYFNEYL